MKRKSIFPTVIFLLVCSYCGGVWAAPTTGRQAETAVTGWLRSNANPLGASLGDQITHAETFTDENDQPLYHIVYLQPSGFVIASADDGVEPIIGFVRDGVYEPSDDNPLAVLLNNDLRGRIAAARSAEGPADAAKCQNKWSGFIVAGENVEEGTRGEDITMTLGIATVDDPRIDPFIQTNWSQGDVAGKCFNYYTPNQYPCGCVATAMAQVMKYYQHPTSGIGEHGFSIKIGNAPWETWYTRGGDGSGGAYDWSNMVLDPDFSTTDTERKAIGALCHDAGLTVNMHYTSDESTADTLKVAGAFTGTFGYGNAIKGYYGGSNIGAGLNGMINPNLDGREPVILAIKGTGGHAIVCDGYGYNSSTMYHHLNMGWKETANDVWYNLPTIITTNPNYTFTSVYKCIYNIRENSCNDDEVISGRVLDNNGDPLSMAVVTTSPDDGMALTDGRGIYALKCLEAATTYTIDAMKKGFVFEEEVVATGTSLNEEEVSGNVWGVDLYGEVLEITGVTPASGPPGSYIEIAGVNFGSLTGEVTIKGQQSGEIQFWSDTLIYCRVPVGLSGGEGLVSIKTADNDPSYGVPFTVTSPGEIIVDPNNSTADIENGTAEYPFSTIQRGIDAATVSGRRVVVYPSVYYENVSFNGVDIIVTSIDPNDPEVAAVTVIDGDHSGSVVTFENSEGVECVLQGFTIRNGSSSYGGGITCLSGAPTIKQCKITGNAAMCGGGICSIDGNPSIVECVVTYNEADQGGGVYFYTCSPVIRRCVVAGNLAEQGGGIYLYGYLLAHWPQIDHCLIVGNSAQYGGGMFSSETGPVVKHCDVISNAASQYGGGILWYGGYMTIHHTILWNGTTPGNPEEIILLNPPSPSYLTIWSSNVQGGLMGVVDQSGSSLHWHGNNINVEPLFVRDPNAGVDGNWDGVDDDFGDLHLREGSLCIEAGDAGFDDPNDLDFEGRERIVDGDCDGAKVIDIGAYEFGYFYLGDFAGDCDVDLGDFGIFAAAWLSEEGEGQFNSACDIGVPGDDRINLADLKVFVENWLVGR